MKNSQKEVLEKVKSKIEKKYSKIKDLEILVEYRRIQVGFGWTNYLHGNPPQGRYPFHEINYSFDLSESFLGKTLTTTKDIFNFLDGRIQEELKWQKRIDEDYAKEHNKKIEYKFDYSIID